VTYNQDFKVTIIQRQLTRKWYNIVCLRWPTNRKSYMIDRTAPFSMTLNDPYHRFQGHSILTLNVSETSYRHSFNGILIGTYIRPTHVSFRMTLSDLAKYSWHEASRGLLRQQSYLSTWTVVCPSLKLGTRYFENEWTDFAANCLKWSTGRG